MHCLMCLIHQTTEWINIYGSIFIFKLLVYLYVFCNNVKVLLIHRWLEFNIHKYPVIYRLVGLVLDSNFYMV